MLKILGSIVNIIGWKLYDHFMSTKMFTLITIEMFICAPKIMRKVT